MAVWSCVASKVQVWHPLLLHFERTQVLWYGWLYVHKCMHVHTWHMHTDMITQYILLHQFHISHFLWTLLVSLPVTLRLERVPNELTVSLLCSSRMSCSLTLEHNGYTALVHIYTSDLWRPLPASRCHFRSRSCFQLKLSHKKGCSRFVRVCAPERI